MLNILNKLILDTSTLQNGLKHRIKEEGFFASKEKTSQTESQFWHHVSKKVLSSARNSVRDFLNNQQALSDEITASVFFGS